MHLKSVSWWWVCASVGLLATVTSAIASDYNDPYDYDYSYGDQNFLYEGEDLPQPILRAESHVAEQSAASTLDRVDGPDVPLCCPSSTLFQVPHNCTAPPLGWSAEPHLSGEPNAHFVYRGFPKCKLSEPVPLYQKDVFFSKGDAFVPSPIHLDPIPPSKFCVAKVYDNTDPEGCEEHRTKVYACLEKREEEPGLYWTGVAIAHLFLALTLLAFFLVRDLRCLQGQYMICFLISLLLYNICLLPGSVLSLSITFIPCVSLGAVKYFFFCGVMLWFNVICFDVWRTLKNRLDVGSRKGFLLYSVYTWVVGAVLTTVVLVMPYIYGKDRDAALMEPDQEVCKLKTDMNMILLLVAGGLMVVDLVFLTLAATHICKYPKFGNGLPRSDATLSLKQGWKLFLIMIVHTLIDVPDDIFDIRVVDLWRYVLVESLAIFAVFAYRKTVLQTLYRFCLCSRHCASDDMEMNHLEKDQLTNGV